MVYVDGRISFENNGEVILFSDWMKFYQNRVKYNLVGRKFLSFFDG